MLITHGKIYLMDLMRRYQIVKDLLSNNFDGRKMGIDEVDNAIFTADLIINRLKTI